MPTNAVYAASPCQPSTIAPAVDGDDVAVLEDGLVVRDAVDDDLVDRGADGRGEPAVPEEVRLRSVLGDHLAGDLVQVQRGGAGDRRLAGGRVNGSDHQPRLTHLRDLLGGLDLHHCAAPLCIGLHRTVTDAAVPTIRRKQSAAAPMDAAADCTRTAKILSQPLSDLRASIARSVTSVTLPSAEMVTTRFWAL